MKLTLAWALPAVAVTPVGAPGAVVGEQCDGAIESSKGSGVGRRHEQRSAVGAQARAAPPAHDAVHGQEAAGQRHGTDPTDGH